MEQTLVSKQELESVLCPLTLLQVLHTCKRVLLDFVLDMLAVGALIKQFLIFFGLVGAFDKAEVLQDLELVRQTLGQAESL